jgi:WD40 repeat protein
LSLEFVVSSLALVGSTFVALGLADGTLKLLDMTTSKVSFYPNTYIQHSKPVCQLIVLRQNKGTRLASLSDENYAIIWTLGENYVPYPERKLVGFKSKLNRLMDIADCSHVLC